MSVRAYNVLLKVLVLLTVLYFYDIEEIVSWNLAAKPLSTQILCNHHWLPQVSNDSTESSQSAELEIIQSRCSASLCFLSILK